MRIGAAAMAERISGVKASVGFASETGRRKSNEDFAGAVWRHPIINGDGRSGKLRAAAGNRQWRIGLNRG